MSSAPTILTVCTGNLCRSPYAEAALRASLPAGLGVASSGTHARDGDPAPDQAIEVAASRGLDLRGHRSRYLLTTHVEAADLVLALARDHRRAAVELAPRAIRRAFTLPEFARLADTLTGADLRAAADGAVAVAVPRALAPDPASSAAASARLAAIVRLVAAQRGTLPPVDPALDDVIDPYGQPDDVYLAMADAIGAATASVARVLAAAAPAGLPAG